MSLPPQYTEDFGGGFAGTINAGNIQVHTREDSGNSIEEMFRVVTDPASSISSARPMKDRNLPPSFFEPSAKPIGLNHLTPTIKVGSASKSPSIASSVSPNFDHLYPEHPDSAYTPPSKNSGSDLALNETFSNINFSDSIHSKVEYHHFRGGGGSSLGQYHSPKSLQPQLQQQPAQQHQAKGFADNLLNVCSDQFFPVEQSSLVSHTRAHSSPAKMSNQLTQQQILPNGGGHGLMKKTVAGYGTQQHQPQYNQTYIEYAQIQQLQQQQQQQQQPQLHPTVALVPTDASAHGSSHPNLSTGEFYQLPGATSVDMSKELPTQQLIDACPVPPGFEMAYNNESRIYFVDHNSKTTSWIDPRLPAEVQSGWGHTAREIALLHQMKCARCSVYRRLTSLTVQKEMLRRQLEATTRSEFLMRQEVFTMHGGGAGVATAQQQQQQQQQQPAVDHRRQESSDSGLASEPVVTPPLLEISGGSGVLNQSMDTAGDTSVDCLLSSLTDSDLLPVSPDFEMQQATFRQDF